MKNNHLITNFVTFQILWIASVQAIWWLSALTLIVFLIIHGMYVAKEKTEWIHAFIFLCLGLIIESTITTLGLIDYAKSISIEVAGTHLKIAPFWLLCLWIGLSISLYHSLSWLQYYPKIAASLISTCLPLSYYFGASLSNSTFPKSTILSLSVITLMWLTLFPLGFILIRKLRSLTYIRD